MTWKMKLDWELTIGNKSVKLRRVDDFFAVHPKPNPAKQSESAKLVESRQSSELAKFLEPLLKGPYEKPKPDKKSDKWLEHTTQFATDLRLFKRGGWNFEPRNKENETAAKERRELNGNIVREVFRTDQGSMLVTTDWVTLKLQREMSEMEARLILKKDELTDIRRLGFGRNLFEAKVRQGKSLPDVIKRLQKTRNYSWVEPTLIQTLKPREAAALAKADAEFSKQWQHANTGFDEDGFAVGKAGEDLDSLRAWELSQGSGVRIAVIDSGMQIDHPDLAAGIKGGGYFLTSPTGSWEFHSLAEDPLAFPVANHGTFCLGLAGARTTEKGQKEQSGVGIAPKSSLIPIACPSNFLATQTTLAAAIHFAVDPFEYDPRATRRQRADVISCSLDTNNPLMSVLAEAIYFANTQGRMRYGRPRGVPIFWAVNNLQTPLSDDPVCTLPEVMAVGKCNRKGEWGGGAVGPELAFLAPGVDVFSTTIGSDNMYGTGTSFATPLAAGVAALVLQRFPNLTAAEVCEKLIASCRPMDGIALVNGAVPHDGRFGYGKLNAFKAVSE